MEKQSFFPPVWDITDDYDDGNIPEVDLPKEVSEPLPEAKCPESKKTQET